MRYTNPRILYFLLYFIYRQFKTAADAVGCPGRDTTGVRVPGGHSTKGAIAVRQFEPELQHEKVDVFLFYSTVPGTNMATHVCFRIHSYIYNQNH